MGHIRNVWFSAGEDGAQMSASDVLDLILRLAHVALTAYAVVDATRRRE